MEKLHIAPFNVEIAKKIQNKELKGRITTADGWPVRILCWGGNEEKGYPVLALVNVSGRELLYSYKTNGDYNNTPSNEIAKLVLEVPEWVTFKDGDVLRVGRILYLIKGEVHKVPAGYYMETYAEVKGDKLDINFDEMAVITSYTIYKVGRRKFYKALKNDGSDKAKDLISRFF